MCDNEKCYLSEDECTCWCECGMPHDQCMCDMTDEDWNNYYEQIRDGD